MAVMALAGCAIQTPQVKDVESGVSTEQQRQKQLEMMEALAPKKLALKRKIAVGRLSNETNYGRSLMRQNAVDQLEGKVTEIGRAHV